jgi:hypothetical protein
MSRQHCGSHAADALHHQAVNTHLADSCGLRGWRRCHQIATPSLVAHLVVLVSYVRCRPELCTMLHFEGRRDHSASIIPYVMYRLISCAHRPWHCIRPELSQTRLCLSCLCRCSAHFSLEQRSRDARCHRNEQQLTIYMFLCQCSSRTEAHTHKNAHRKSIGCEVAVRQVLA